MVGMQCSGRAARSVDTDAFANGALPCFGHGVLTTPIGTNTSVCVCFTGYTTHGTGAPCSYAIKDRTTAFTFSILLGVLGIDQFYLGNIALAVCKLIFQICTVGLWYLIDYILVGCGYYTDANGVPISSWYFNVNTWRSVVTAGTGFAPA